MSHLSSLKINFLKWEICWHIADSRCQALAVLPYHLTFSMTQWKSDPLFLFSNHQSVHFLFLGYWLSFLYFMPFCVWLSSNGWEAARWLTWVCLITALVIEVTLYLSLICWLQFQEVLGRSPEFAWVPGLWFMVLGSEMAGSCDRSSFNFPRNWQTVFPNSRFFFFLHPYLEWSRVYQFVINKEH